MTTEKGLYTQVVKTCQKYLKFISENNNKNESKFKFQGLSERPQCCFDLDFDCTEVNFITREPYLYKKLFQSHNNIKDINTFKSFQVPI